MQSCDDHCEYFFNFFEVLKVNAKSILHWNWSKYWIHFNAHPIAMEMVSRKFPGSTHGLCKTNNIITIHKICLTNVRMRTSVRTWMKIGWSISILNVYHEKPIIIRELIHVQRFTQMFVLLYSEIEIFDQKQNKRIFDEDFYWRRTFLNVVKSKPFICWTKFLRNHSKYSITFMMCVVLLFGKGNFLLIISPIKWQIFS